MNNMQNVIRPFAVACLARLLLALPLTVLFAPSLVAAQSSADKLHLDIREAVLRVPVSVPDAAGRTVAGDLVVTTFKPAGPGPFPLLIISHGRSSQQRASFARQRFESAARFFVRKGFAVAVPLRLGYGELADLGDPESSGTCARPRYAQALDAAAQQILAVAQAMALQPDVDASRLVLVGQSVGGMATLAAAALRPAGLLAAINFAGGHGGSPIEHPGVPCQPEQLTALFQGYGAATATATATATPTLWIYTRNDFYFGPQHSRAWADAYQAAGGQVDYQLLPAIGDDGHKLFAQANDVWQPLLDAFLAQHGFAQTGTLTAPPASGFAALADAAALPVQLPAVRVGYQQFLAAKSPRAFAVNAAGQWGYASGEDVMSRALSFCQRQVSPASLACSLYAVNDSVVWNPQ
jgi:dienelactone hydrolase